MGKKQTKYTKKSNRNKTRRNKQKQYVGGKDPRKLNIYFGVVTHQTLGDCIKELIEASYHIYRSLLSENRPITIVCGGQSPSYYCLAMMNFYIFNPERVNIVVLPHSKGGVKSSNQYSENVKYCNRLKEKGIELRSNVVIIDGVHSGTGILALESALKHCYPSISIRKFAINAVKGISKIPVDREYILPCEPKFSDTFPRLVTSYHPRNFNNSSKFITKLNIEGNPVAEMIIDIAQKYPDIPVESTEWFQLNNIVTAEIKKEREEIEKIVERLEKEKIVERLEKERLEKERLEKERLEKERLEQLKREEGGTYTPIIQYNTVGKKIYECPICHLTSGTAAPMNPTNLSLSTHRFDCPNKFKIPIE